MYLPMYLPMCLPMCLPMYLPTYLSIYLASYLSIYIYPSIPISTYLYLRYLYLSLPISTYLYLSLPISLSVSPSSHPSVLKWKLENIKTEAILQGILKKWKFTAPKPSNSARLPQLSQLTASKTKQFSESSSLLELDNVKNEKLWRDFLNLRNWQHQKRSNSARLPSQSCWVPSWPPRANAFCVFSSPCLLKTTPATNKWDQVIRSAANVTQNHLWKPEDLILKNGTSLRKSSPWPPNISDEHVSCFAPATRKNASLQFLFKRYTLAIIFETATKPSRFAYFLARCRIHCASHEKWRLNVQKRSEHVALLPFWLRSVLRAGMCFGPRCGALFQLLNFKKRPVRHWDALNSFTSKFAHNNSVNFFNMSASKNVPRLKHFDFKIFFVPKRHAIVHLSSGQMAPHPPL